VSTSGGPSGGGSGSISEITSTDDSVTITDPTGPTTNLSVAGGGGGAGGALIVHDYDFTFNTPNLLTGAQTGYVPKVGDVVYGAWISISTAWDGTTPLGDFGQFDAINTGLLDQVGRGINDMTTADEDLGGTDSPTFAQGNGLIANGIGIVMEGTSPFLMVVSQDGTNDGADPGSTVGAATLHILYSTPGGGGGGGGSDSIFFTFQPAYEADQVPGYTGNMQWTIATPPMDTDPNNQGISQLLPTPGLVYAPGAAIFQAQDAIPALIASAVIPVAAGDTISGKFFINVTDAAGVNVGQLYAEAVLPNDDATTEVDLLATDYAFTLVGGTDLTWDAGTSTLSTTAGGTYFVLASAAIQWT
jgi:hypothetical protein